MIANDQNFANFSATGALALALFIPLTSLPASAAEMTAAAPGAAAAPSAAASLQTKSADSQAMVTIVRDGSESTFATTARTVGGLFAERNIALAAGDYLSPDADDAVVDGMKIVYRPSVAVVLHVDRDKRVVHSAAATIGDLLAAHGVNLGPRDEVRPAPDTKPFAREIVRVVRVASWTASVRRPLEAKVQRRTDERLSFGKTRVVDAGFAGIRETTYRVERRGGETATRTTLASRIIRAPRAKVIARGIATYTSLARVAQQGFMSAMNFAGSALHMIATAYTGGCYGCSGVTASGTRAGFGVIAVDPHIIPLGSKLFVPGYGRAVAGDTGASIVGHRIDLGMNTQRAALQFGRRSVTVYVLR